MTAGATMVTFVIVKIEERRKRTPDSEQICRQGHRLKLTNYLRCYLHQYKSVPVVLSLVFVLDIET